VLGCVVLAIALPPTSLIGGTALLLGGAAVFAIRSSRRTAQTHHPTEA
jgi:hypothetical protein